MTKTMLLRAITLVSLLASAPILAACHTTAGAGEDVSAAGRSISRGGQAIERSAVRNTP